MSKIVVIGAGYVGATIAYALMVGGSANEIVLIDKIKEKARGESMDLNHSASFVKPVTVYAGEYEDCAGADIIIVTAGAPQRQGESRLELVQTNTRIIQSIISSILPYNNNPIFIIVTNPVDIISYVAWKSSGLPSSQVIGSGTVLDTSRFRHLLSLKCNVDPRNVHAHVIGEHGDSEVLQWSTANIGGMKLDDFCRFGPTDCTAFNKKEIEQKVRQAAYEVIEGKGATYYAVSLAIRRIVESIMRNEHSILTVSTHVNGYYGVYDVYLSLPSVISENGVEGALQLELSPEEEEEFKRSAYTIADYIPYEQFPLEAT